MLTLEQLLQGSKKELLAVLHKVDPAGFEPATVAELRLVLHKLAFCGRPALKATLQKVNGNGSPLCSQVVRILLWLSKTS
jgi:hypothetical protein